MNDESLYREELLYLAKHPKSYGQLAGASFCHEEINATCGDKLRVWVKIENDLVMGMSWEGEGCLISRVGGSCLAEFARGKSLEELAEAMPQDYFGFPIIETRLRCADLALKALRNGYRVWRSS